MTLQSPTASLNAPAAVPALRSVFRRVFDAFIEGRRRKAAREIAEHLRYRGHQSDDFRIEFERRFMGQ